MEEDSRDGGMMTTGLDTLIVPVGGTAAAPLNAVRHAAPVHVVFLVSAQSRALVDREILPALEIKPTYLRCIMTPDAESLTATLKAISEALPAILHEWQVSWDAVLVDVTGGTKVMAAALVLATVERVGRYLYIGGTVRTKGGVGTVADGRERPVETVNPWEALAIPARARATASFNGLQFAAALREIDATLPRLAAGRLKARLQATRQIVEGFAAWDRFQYKDGLNALKKAKESCMGAFEDDLSYGPFLSSLGEAVSRLEAIEGARREEAPSEEMLRDLLANAARRGRVEGKFDDAVARLYRFIEGVVQCRLFEKFKLRTAEIPLDSLPAGPRWDDIRARRLAPGRRSVELGQRDAARLLADRGDEVGLRISNELERGRRLADLVRARNHSLLAHGTVPVRKETFENLLDLCVELTGWGRDTWVRFPVLPG
jgi:CRISPR-associated protein (TIGR02710 family)